MVLPQVQAGSPSCPTRRKSSVKHDIESQIVEMWPTDAVRGRSIPLTGGHGRRQHLLHGHVSVSPQAVVVVQDTCHRHTKHRMPLYRSVLVIFACC